MPKPHPAIKTLEQILGKKNVLFSLESRLVYASDVTKFRRLPSVVVFPRSVEDVVQIVKTARRFQLPITARGAGTGMSGGAVPSVDGLVISFSRMNKILEIDYTNKIAFVEPGVVTSKIQDEVLKKGLFYPPDPSSYKICTIGGNIAENAGGLRCLKYGVTSDYILGLEIIDYEGERYTTGILANSEDEIDMTPVFCGSEGMLGLVVKAALKLIDAPKSFITMSVEFPSAVSAAKTVTAILNSGHIPCILEFIDKQTLDAITGFIKIDLSPAANAVLLIEFDESPDLNAQLADKTADICMNNGAFNIKIASSPEERDNLWKLRRAISPSLTRIASGKINEDIAIPRGRIEELIAFIEKLSAEMGRIIPVYGHAGDGNLHVNFLYDVKNPEDVQSAKTGVEKLLREVVRLEGTISGEHGIGLAKQPYLPLQLSDSSLKLHRRLKLSFDPVGIFNNDKMLP